MYQEKKELLAWAYGIISFSRLRIGVFLEDKMGRPQLVYYPCPVGKKFDFDHHASFFNANTFMREIVFASTSSYMLVLSFSSIVELTFFILLDDSFEHVGSILVNISKNEAGRKILLDPKRGLLKQIIRQFDSSSPLRKKGVCFEIAI